MRVPQYTPSVNRNISNGQISPAGDINAYGGKQGENWNALAKGLDNLNRVQLQIEEERQVKDAVQASNELIEKLSPRLDYYSSLEFDGAKGSSEAYQKEARETYEEIVKKYKFNKNSLAVFKHQSDRFAQVSTRVVNRNQIVQQKRQDELSFKLSNIKEAELAMTDGDVVENLGALYFNIDRKAAVYYGENGKELVEAKALETKTDLFKGICVTLINQGRIEDAREIIDASDGIIPKGVLSDLGAKTAKLAEVSKRAGLVKNIWVASGGSFEVGMKMIDESDIEDKDSVRRDFNKLHSERETYHKKIVDENTDELFDKVVFGNIRNYEEAYAHLIALSSSKRLSGRAFDEMDKKLRNHFDIDERGEAKSDDPMTIAALEIKLHKGELNSSSIDEINSLKKYLTPKARIDYIKKAIKGDYKLSEAQERNIQNALAEIDSAISDSGERKMAHALIYQNAQHFKNEREALDFKDNMLKSKLYTKNNFPPAVRSRAVLTEALTEQYGGAVETLGKVTEGFGRNVSDWDADKNLKATTSLLEKTFATLNTDGMENPTEFYQKAVQGFIEEIGKYAPDARPRDEKEFLRLWENFLSAHSRKTGRNLYRSLSQNNPAPPNNSPGTLYSESENWPLFEGVIR